MRAWTRLIEIGALVGAFTACSTSDGGVDASCPSTNAVTMASRRFVPACIKVSAGTKVTFTNTDITDHTVAAEEDQSVQFRSGNLRPNDAFDFTFTTASTTRVVCTYHAPDMRMVVAVE